MDKLLIELHERLKELTDDDTYFSEIKLYNYQNNKLIIKLKILAFNWEHDCIEFMCGTGDIVITLPFPTIKTIVPQPIGIDLYIEV